MELELECTQLSGFETVLDTTVFHEETMEMIVPDACPDILRIWDSEGQACLSSREALDGRINLSGIKHQLSLHPHTLSFGKRIQHSELFQFVKHSFTSSPGYRSMIS